MPRLLIDTAKGRMASIVLALVTMVAGSTGMASQSETVEISITAQQGFQFEPTELEIPVGAEVILVFENAGIMGHNLHIPELEVMTDTITPGKTETVEFTFDEAGTYAFRCEVPGHAEAGMTGKLVVQ
ncbi:plastocyanin [Halomonas fontilapidosi]|uniref:Plastocyanin n=1 Tax=Halomonas fontilapidosi TaxID=616675 RepID=A0A7W5H0D8_9GAMM|nr:cupredoxin domain-containing protein [Halomonas fontilapidosi]MBB3185555.1 plastocyanin [Halomonas fontilapidosi]